MNPDNLRPAYTTEEAKKRGRNGGIASGKARRARKAMSEQMRDALDITARKGKPTDFAKIKCQKDIEDGNFTIEQQIILATLSKARKGDISAVRMVREILGIEEQPVTVSPLDRFAESLEAYRDDGPDDSSD